MMVLQRRTNGYNPVDQLRTQMDRLVGDFFGPASVGARAPRCSRTAFRR